MAILFPTEDWIQALKAELNASDDYREAARTWEGDFTFRVEAGVELARPVELYMDLWHGECRAAHVVSERLARPAEFTIEAGVAQWRKVIEGRLDPIQAIVTRQLKLAGPMVKVMRAPRAATALVSCCTRIPTAWPAGPAA